MNGRCYFCGIVVLDAGACVKHLAELKEEYLSMRRNYRVYIDEEIKHAGRFTHLVELSDHLSTRRELGLV